MSIFTDEKTESQENIMLAEVTQLVTDSIQLVNPTRKAIPPITAPEEVHWRVPTSEARARSEKAEGHCPLLQCTPEAGPLPLQRPDQRCGGICGFSPAVNG